MKILKKGNYFRAYVSTKSEEVCGRKIGNELGSISITTGRFAGATDCMSELRGKLHEYEESQIPKTKREKIIQQIELMDEIRNKTGINVVNCGNCGSVLLHKMVYLNSNKSTHIHCLYCGETLDHSDCPDLLYSGMENNAEFQD